MDVRVAEAADAELVRAEREPRVGVLGLKLRRVEYRRSVCDGIPTSSRRRAPTPTAARPTAGSDRGPGAPRTRARATSFSGDRLVRGLHPTLREPRRGQRVEDAETGHARQDRENWAGALHDRRPAQAQQHAHRHEHRRRRRHEVPVDVGKRMKEIDGKENCQRSRRGALVALEPAQRLPAGEQRESSGRRVRAPARGAPSRPAPGARRCAAPRSRPSPRGSAAVRSRTCAHRGRRRARPGRDPTTRPTTSSGCSSSARRDGPIPERRRPCRGTRRATPPAPRSQPLRRRRRRPRPQRALHRAAAPSGAARRRTAAHRPGRHSVRGRARPRTPRTSASANHAPARSRVDEVWRWSTRPGCVDAHATTTTAGTPAATIIARLSNRSRDSRARDTHPPRRRGCPPAST